MMGRTILGSNTPPPESESACRHCSTCQGLTVIPTSECRNNAATQPNVGHSSSRVLSPSNSSTPPFSCRSFSPTTAVKILHRTLRSHVAWPVYTIHVVSPHCDAGLGGSDVCPMVSPSFELQLGLLLTSIVVTTVRRIAAPGPWASSVCHRQGRDLTGPASRVTYW